MVFQS